MAYFKSPKTIEELRTQYKKLMKQYHPDVFNGSDEHCKAINAEYEQLFRRLKDVHEQQTSEGYREETTSERTSYSWEFDEQLRDILSKLVVLDGIEIEVCGIWVWVAGDTRQYKEQFKAWGMHWSSKKSMWNWHMDELPYKRKKSTPMSQIRAMYGSEKVSKTQQPRLA